jgi:hypothetical protein
LIIEGVPGRRQRREALRDACSAALSAEVESREVRARLGDFADSESSFERVVFDDLADVVGDASSSRLQRAVRALSGRPRATRRTLLLDRYLLEEDVSVTTNAELFRCRNLLADAAHQFDEEVLSGAVQSCLATGRAVTPVIEVNDATRLDDVTEHIHDHYFDLADIDYDRAEASITVPFRSGDKDPVRRLLRFESVEALAIRDTERIATYDFNELRWNAAARTIHVRTNVPLGFDVAVDEVRVTLERTFG